MIARADALELLKANTPEPHLLVHALETEAVMAGLARRLGRDEALWSLAGLLHDLDYSATKDDPSRHGKVSAEMLAGKLPDEAVAAIRNHAFELNGSAPSSEFDFALRCGETVTGLVHAGALVRPERMKGMTVSSLKKKMKSKAFAANVSREIIQECAKIGLTLDEFLQVSIESVDSVAAEVGLA